MRKYMSLVLAAICLLMGLTACGEKQLTPDQMFDTVEAAKNVRLEMQVNYDGIQTSSTIIEQAGDITKVRMETSSFGATSGDEYYTETVGDEQYLYAKNEEGVWGKEKIGEWFTPASVDGFAGLFADGLYYKDEEKGKEYRMYESSSVELDSMTFRDAELKQDEDGNFVLTAVVTRTIDEMPVYGSVTLTIRVGGEVKVTLPKAEIVK